MTTPSSAEMLNFLKKTLTDFQTFTEKLKFDKEHALHHTIITLYGSITELTTSCVVLIDNKTLTGVPILLRTTLEAYIDLTNLINEPTYGYYLKISFLRQWVSMARDARESTNPYLASIASHPSLDEFIQQFENEIKLLESQGYNDLSIKKKFTRADREHEYKSIYNILCCDSHNNFRSLMHRHFDIQNEDFSIVFYKDSSQHTGLLMYIGLITEFFLTSTKMVHEFFKCENIGKIQTYVDDFIKMNSSEMMATV